MRWDGVACVTKKLLGDKNTYLCGGRQGEIS